MLPLISVTSITYSHISWPVCGRAMVPDCADRFIGAWSRISIFHDALRGVRRNGGLVGIWRPRFCTTQSADRATTSDDSIAIRPRKFCRRQSPLPSRTDSERPAPKSVRPMTKTVRFSTKRIHTSTNMFPASLGEPHFHPVAVHEGLPDYRISLRTRGLVMCRCCAPLAGARDRDNRSAVLLMPKAANAPCRTPVGNIMDL
jgi:hypothetical protein